MEAQTSKGLVWGHLKANPNSCAREVAIAIGIPVHSCRVILRQLVINQLIEKVSGAGTVSSPMRFTIIEGCKPRFESNTERVSLTRFNKSARQKLWNNMKIEQVFSVRTITAPIDASEIAAERFIKQLLRAGYLERIIHSRRKAKHRFSYRYRLIRDTGRLAPISRRNGMWDRNEKEFYSYIPAERKDIKEEAHELVR